MIEEIIGGIFVVLVVFGMVRGAVAIALGGFISIAVGALFASTFLSLLLSSLAAVSLQGLSEFPSTSTSIIVLRGLLAALAQPTLSGVALLATLVVICYGIVKASLLALDIRILFDSHAEALSLKSSKEQ